MRLDVFLAEHGMAPSRSRARAMIEAGDVSVNGTPVLRPSFSVEGDEKIKVTDSLRYVGRGGLKLEAAIDAFSVSCQGKVALDVGASSGGFTDCLLQNGAQKVIAVDSGSGQLVDKIRQNDKVVVIENYNARYMKVEDFPCRPNFAVMDVSFISATYIIPALSECLDFGADFVCLIKPQFEVGRAALGKGGIVKDEKARRGAIDKVVDCALAHGFESCGVITSPIKGGDGNVEFLAHFRKLRNS